MLKREKRRTLVATLLKMRWRFFFPALLLAMFLRLNLEWHTLTVKRSFGGHEGLAGQAVVSTARLFGPPTGGVLRERPGSHYCWAQQDNNHELRGSTLQEINAPSEWTKGSREDQLMLSKAWDFAYRWRTLNLLPAFGFVRRLLSQEIMDRLTYIDYLTHLGNPSTDMMKLDTRYLRHRAEHEFLYPCAPWLQFEDEANTSLTDDAVCSEAVSCDACVAKDGCGWCTSGGDGICKAITNNQSCDYWDVHQCQPTLIGAFLCGPCTGGTEAVNQMASQMNQMGLRNEIFTSCPDLVRNCRYDVPYLVLKDLSSLGNITKRRNSAIWTCMGCSGGDWVHHYGPLASASEAPKYLVILGHHLQMWRSPKMSGWKAVSTVHNHYSLMFESGTKMWSTSIGSFWFHNQLPLNELAPLKEDIVVYDPDSPFDLECVKRNAHDLVGNHTQFRLVPLSGMTRAEWHLLAQKAKGMIDLELPGYEFGNLEAVLNGAVHIPSAHGVGRNKRDYPIPDHNRIFLHQMSGNHTPCQLIGKRVGEILQNWKEEVAKQEDLLRVVSRMRNEQWLDLLQFFVDDVSVVMSGMSQRAYEAAHAVGFAGSFLYPHASFQITAQNNAFAYWDFNSAIDLFSNFVGSSPFDWELWTPPVDGDASVIVGPIQKDRLYVAFLPCGYLPMSKYFFGYLASELERRNHRHWLLCPESGLIFARRWWFTGVQAKLTEAVRSQTFIQEASSNSSLFTSLLFKLVFGKDEFTAAALDSGTVYSHGFFLYGDN